MRSLVKNKSMIKILVIDDEPGICSFLSNEFEFQGYTVVTAPDGEKGLELVRKEKFHLVLTDIMMPNVDGMRVLCETKKIDPSIEVIIITGYGTVTRAVDAIKHGAYDFIQKPLDVDEITSLVERAVEKVEMKALLDIYEAAMSIISAVRIEDLLPVLSELSMNILKADDVSIILENENNELVVLASSGVINHDERVARLMLCRQYYGQVKQLKDGMLVEDVSCCEAAAPGSVMLCPLTTRMQTSGILCAARAAGKTKFVSADLVHADIFAVQISGALDNAKLYRKLEDKIKELNEAYGQLQAVKNSPEHMEKLEVMGKMFLDITHKLNNALSIVIGFSDLLLSTENDSERKSELVYIKTQAQDCAKLITNIVHTSKDFDKQRLKAVNE